MSSEPTVVFHSVVCHEQTDQLAIRGAGKLNCYVRIKWATPTNRIKWSPCQLTQLDPNSYFPSFITCKGNFSRIAASPIPWKFFGGFVDSATPPKEHLQVNKLSLKSLPMFANFVKFFTCEK